MQRSFGTLLNFYTTSSRRFINKYCSMFKFRGEGLNKIFSMEAPPRGPAPYPFISRFDRNALLSLPFNCIGKRYLFQILV